MAKRKEYSIKVNVDVDAKLSPEQRKKLERQIKQTDGKINVEGISRDKVESLKEYNRELEKYRRLRESIRTFRGMTLGDFTDDERFKSPRVQEERPLTQTERKRAMLSEIEAESRIRHHAPSVIDSDQFIKQQGNVIGRSYIDKTGNLVDKPLPHGEALFQELSQMGIDINSVRALTRTAQSIQSSPSSPYNRAILPAILNLRRHGVFDDSVFSSQLSSMENRQGTPTFNRVIEAYIRELTRAGYPVKPSQLASGVTSDFRSFQGSREWLKYMQMGGLSEQLLFNVKLPILSLMARPTTQFAYHLLNSGVKPHIATDKAFDIAKARGLNDIAGFESMRFDPEYYYDPVNYRTVDPEFVSKPGRRIAIIPSGDIYNPSYIPLTTGLKRNIAGFDPSMFNPEIAAALNQSIYPHGGNTPAWDYMTNRNINDFDYHKYIA